MRFLSSTLAVVFLTACGGGGGAAAPEPATPTPTPVPTPPPTPSIELNVDAAFEYGMADGRYTQAMIIYQDGDVLRSEYRGITTNETANLPAAVSALSLFYLVRNENDFVHSWSVGKSVTSVLIGIAIDRGFIEELDQSASDYINEWADDTRANITIRNLLDMRSGLINNDYDNGQFGPTGYLDFTGNCINRQLRGDNSFQYINCDYQVLGEILERATGQDFMRFADDELFSKIGAEAYMWQDASGNYHTYSGLDMTANDFLEFGKFLVDDNQTILSDDYRQEILTRSGTSRTYNLGFWYGGGLVTARGADGQGMSIDNENKVVVIRNSLYYVTSQDRVLDVTTSIPTVPLTLPALAGGSNDFDFSEVLNRLYSE